MGLAPMLNPNTTTKIAVAEQLMVPENQVWKAQDLIDNGMKPVGDVVGDNGSVYAIVSGRNGEGYVGSTDGKPGQENSTVTRLNRHLTTDNRGSLELSKALSSGKVLMADLFVVILAVMPTPTPGEVNLIRLREQEFIYAYRPCWNVRDPVTNGVLPYASSWTLTDEQRQKISDYFTPAVRAAVAERVKNESQKIRDRKTATLRTTHAKTVNRYDVTNLLSGTTTTGLTAGEAQDLTCIPARSFMRYMKETQGEWFEKRDFKVVKSFSNPYYNYGGPTQGGATGYRTPRSKGGKGGKK